MNCKKCGYPLTQDDIFCRNCGEQVNTQNEQITIPKPANNDVDLMASPMPNFVSTNNSIPNPMQQTTNNETLNNIETLTDSAPLNNFGYNMESTNNIAPTNIPNSIGQVNNASPLNSPLPNDMRQIENNQSLNEFVPNNNTSNYPNNNLNNTQNGYYSTPNYQQQKPNKSNSTSTYVIIAVAIAILAVGAIFGTRLLSNKNNNNNNSNNNNSSGGSEVINKQQSTYTVRFKGFTFKIPTNLIYQNNETALVVGDEASTWETAIEVVSGSYSQLVTNKSNLIPAYQQIGFSANNLNQKTYGGLDFITIELSKGGTNALLALTKANSMNIFVATTYNLNNNFDYNKITEIAKILSTAEYIGETNNITETIKVDLEPVKELLK